MHFYWIVIRESCIELPSVECLVTLVGNRLHQLQNSVAIFRVGHVRLCFVSHLHFRLELWMNGWRFFPRLDGLAVLYDFIIW